MDWKVERMHNSMMNKTTPRDVLARLMSNRGVNQNQLWKASGVSQGTISRILNGVTPDPKRPVLQKLADYFDIPVAAFYGEGQAGNGVVPGQPAEKGLLAPETRHALQVAIYTANVLRETDLEMEIDKQVELAELLLRRLVTDAREHASPEAEVINLGEVRRMIKMRLAAISAAS